MNSNFFDAWNIYSTVVKQNYMYHNEIIANISEEISAMGELSILDLGCGDSHIVANSVPASQLRNYLGIDSSETAIACAKKNLCNNGYTAKYIFGNMAEQIDKLTETFNLIIAGYSLHHLQSSEKEVVIQKVSNLLDENGVFIFYDVMSRPEEDELEYNQRACQIYKSKWQKLQLIEREGVVSHVMENDHPETEAVYNKMLCNAGFNNLKICFRDQDDLFCMFAVKKDNFA